MSAKTANGRRGAPGQVSLTQGRLRRDHSLQGDMKAIEEPPALESLVKKLVAQAKQAGARPAVLPTATGGNGAGGEVLFACEVDGVRCTLARTCDGSEDDRSLSPREQEIARMIAKGHPNKVIASVLEISVWTVSTHLRRIFAKLSVTSRAAMVAWMFKHGKL